MQTAPPQMATHDIEGELSWVHPSIKTAVCNVAPVQYTSHMELLLYKRLNAVLGLSKFSDSTTPCVNAVLLFVAQITYH